MPQNNINAWLSPDVVEFDPNGTTATFSVYVQNLSDEFALFRLDLGAPGSDPNLGHRWYKLPDEVATKKPPGASTEFIVTIIQNPVPGAETINVTVTVSSLEFRDIQRLPLRLLIKSGGPPRIDVYLPSRHLLAFPRQLVQIPVQVFNPNQSNVDVLLRLVGFHLSWLPERDERRVLVGAGQRTEATFACQPPIAMQAPSGQYTFRVEAYLFGSLAGKDEGIFEVVPVGTIMFSVSPKQFWTPPQSSWLPHLASEPGIYQLQLKNASNLAQNITISLEGKDVNIALCELNPPQTSTRAGETQIMTFTASKKRPWLGLTQKLQFQLITALSDSRLGKTDPPYETVELYLRPIIPLWLQSLLALLLLALLLLLLPREHHTGPVNSVQFSGVINPVLSGSDDQTVRAWDATPDNPLCSLLGWQRYCFNPRGVLVTPATNGTNGKSVTVLKFRAEQTDQVAVGLENGEIILWDVLKKDAIRSFSQQKSDRVFALAFTKNSEYLFSGHGLKLRLWKLNQDVVTPLDEKNLGFAIYTLALSKDERTLIVAGRYNRISIGEWNNRNTLPQFRRLEYPSGNQNDYIDSIAVVDNLLATADTQGNIHLWDLNDCKGRGTDSLNCKLIEQWQMLFKDGQPMPVRSLDISIDGRYLVAAGDDGKIVLWPLTETHQRQPELINGKVIAKYSKGINSIDLKIEGQRLLIVSGSKDNEVRLNTYLLKNQP